jgi:hypothetical protein
MNNRAHKKEKAEERSKESFTPAAIFIVHYAFVVVHQKPPKLP